MKTELELALRYEADERRAPRAPSLRVEEVDRLIQLAEDLLVVARSEADGCRSTSHGPTSAPARRRRRALRGARATRVGRELARRARARPRASKGDRLRVEQALTNLVDNALRHGEGEVTLRAEAGTATSRCTCTDEGDGFPAEFMPRAFERFSRADEARAGGGAGLGLAIVEAIARAHGGRPARRTPPAAAPTSGSSCGPTAPPKPLHKARKRLHGRFTGLSVEPVAQCKRNRR